jgi:hypothetical protein
MKSNEDKWLTPWILPEVRWENTIYTVDLKLKEFRDSQRPYLNIPIDSKQGQFLCKHCGIIGCPSCQTYIMISSTLRDEDIYCVACGTAL